MIWNVISGSIRKSCGVWYKRTLVCIFQFHNFCRKIALLKVNWGFMHHTLEIGSSSSSPPSPAGLRTEIGMRWIDSNQFHLGGFHYKTFWLSISTLFNLSCEINGFHPRENSRRLTVWRWWRGDTELNIPEKFTCKETSNLAGTKTKRTTLMMLQIVRNWQILASALRRAAASSRGKDSPKFEIIFSWIIEKEG